MRCSIRASRPEASAHQSRPTWLPMTPPTTPPTAAPPTSPVTPAPIAVPTPAPTTVSRSRSDMPAHAARFTARNVHTSSLLVLFIVSLHRFVAQARAEPAPATRWLHYGGGDYARLGTAGRYQCR